MTGWQQGRAAVEALIAKRHLEQVPPAPGQARQLLAEASDHLISAAEIAERDPAGGYALAYDAARKALAAVLANQGLRVTSRGGHLAIYEAVRAQLVPPMGNVIGPFNRMRQRRNQIQYPAVDSPRVTAADVAADTVKVAAILDLANRVIPEMTPF